MPRRRADHDGVRRRAHTGQSRWLGQSTGGKYTLGLSLLASYLLIVIFDARGRGNLNTGDSNNLVQGARSALECLGAGDFVGCGHLTGSIQTEVFPYPLLQYLPAGFLVRLGFSDGHVLEALGIVSFVALVIALAGVLVTFRSRPRHAALALLALVGSSAIYQSTSAFGESLVASLVVLAVCAGIRRSPQRFSSSCSQHHSARRRSLPSSWPSS